MSEIDVVLQKWSAYPSTVSVTAEDVTLKQLAQLAGFNVDSNKPTLFKFVVKDINGDNKEFDIIIQHDSWSRASNLPDISAWALEKYLSTRAYNMTHFFNQYTGSLEKLVDNTAVLPIPFGVIPGLDALLERIGNLPNFKKVFAYDMLDSPDVSDVAIKFELHEGLIITTRVQYYIAATDYNNSDNHGKIIDMILGNI